MGARTSCCEVKKCLLVIMADIVRGAIAKTVSAPFVTLWMVADQ